MRKFRDLAELEEAVGSDLGHSDWYEIGQDRIDLFADATDDHHWIHVDTERAKHSRFGATVAHGFLTLSLLPRLAGDILRIETESGVNYGVEKVRFLSPVSPGDRIRAHAVLVSARRRDDALQITLHYTVELEGSSKPACVADIVSLHY